MAYYFVQEKELRWMAQPPSSVQPLLSQTRSLLPPLISKLHLSLQAWRDGGVSPGPVVADRIWVDGEGALVFHFINGQRPKPLMQVGLAPDLAAWLVLLDKWMETFVVVARARSIWSVTELAAALTFLTPAFLPPALVQQPPDNWTRVATALAVALADGPLHSASHDRHWQL
jgi:hypothetical protein